jgi:decaprenylphospho-beta-D-ribofuranose 2-oxidase
MGLTGFILEARIRLRRVESAYMDVRYERARDLDDVLERSAAGDRDYEYCVAWIDCMAAGSRLGRSILMRANHAPVSALPERARQAPHRTPNILKPTVPFLLPNFTLSRLTMGVFNEGFYRVHGDSRRVVDCDRYFYPLDRIHHWNLIYGRRGVLQYQLALPPETARQGLREVLERLTRARRPSFLAVLKSFGAASQGLLSFPRPGFTLALDLPHTGPDLVAELRGLDALVAKLGGRVYLAKDACLEPELFAAMYPALPQFRDVKAKIDPSGRFASSQARRLKLAAGA